MNPSKAIEILEKDVRGELCPDDPDLQNAERLGIEALKAIKRVRPTGYDDIDMPLPGETP